MDGLEEYDIRNPPQRRCMLCGREFGRKRWNNGHLESTVKYWRRETCSPECRQELRAQQREKLRYKDHKPCASCGKAFVRRTRPCGRLEPLGEFNRRKTCSYDCMIRLQSRVKREKHK